METNSNILLIKSMELAHRTRKYLEFCVSHSLEQVITRPTQTTDQAATMIDHILKKLTDKISQSDVIALGLLVIIWFDAQGNYSYSNSIIVIYW